ncbi:MAG: Hsp20/alpha crystallin family protein [Chitinophagia bacterium]|nr:Hsp20/alpha crystallin family protein [Chitinophagia bacterium]
MSGLFEDMFQNGWNKWNEEATAYSAPVNIHETDKSYEMQLVAPGVKKEEFKINVEKNILTISYEHKDEHTEQKENRVLRKEYQARSFKRSFTLNDRIDANGIQAQYSEGMLHLSLPKKEEAEASVKEIAIN